MSRVRVERVHWIDAQIRAGLFPNAHSVAARFEVSARAAYDDSAFMRNRLGAPIRTDSLRGGWYYTDPTYALPFLALPEREADGLRRSLLAARAYLGPADEGLIDGLLARLEPYLPHGGANETMGGMIGLAPGVQIDGELLAACRLGVQKRRRLWLRYWSAHRDEVNERTVQPARLLHYQIEPHLIAWCEWKQELRQFFVARVREWRLLEEEGAFEPVPDAEIDDYLRKGLGAQHGHDLVTVRARFTAYQSRWIRERQYHPSQRTTDLPDGGLILTLQVAGLAEVKRWLLSYGAEVEALEPPALREEIAAELKKMFPLYAGPAQ